MVELLRTGLMLGSLADNLVEALPDDAYPGEGNAAVVVEMLRGSMAPASLDDADVARGTDVMNLAGEELIEQLEGACELAQRTHRGPDSIGHNE